MEFDRKDIPMNKMVVTSLESKFNVFDLRTQHPTKGFASLTEKVSTRFLCTDDSKWKYPHLMYGYSRIQS